MSKRILWNNSKIQLLMSIARPDLSTPEFAARVLKFFNKLFAMKEKNPQEEASERLVASLAEMTEISINDIDKLVKGRIFQEFAVIIFFAKIS